MPTTDIMQRPGQHHGNFQIYGREHPEDERQEERWKLALAQQPSKVTAALGYTPMTLSRVVKELTATGLVSAYTVGRSRWLRMTLPPQQAWVRAKPLLRPPVKRTVWVLAEDSVVNRLGRLAGLSALAHYSMLTEPKWPVYVLSAKEWKSATNAGVQALSEPVAGARE